MKIKKLKLDNFAKFTNFEIEFDGEITNLVGINGSGKTTIGLTAIWACLKGISKNKGNGQLIGEQFRFIGSNKPTADLELTLFDEKQNAEIKVRNRISKTGNKITFDAPDDYLMSKNWLNNLLSVAFLSAKNFTSYSPKEQAVLLGIDTSEFDNTIKTLKQDYTIINRELRGLGEIETVEPVEKVSISELLEEKNKVDEFNHHHLELEKQRDYNVDTVRSHQNKINELHELIAEYTDEIRERNDMIVSINSTIKNTIIEEHKDTRPIVEKINNAEQINEKAMEYQQYLEKKDKQNKIKEGLDSNNLLQKDVAKDRLDYIKSFNFGSQKLSVDEDGGLLLNGRPIREPYFSKGELEMIVAEIHAKMNPKLKVRFIDDFELLDEKNQERIIKNLIKNDFQIITAQVGDKSNRENTVLLRECETVEAN